MLSLTTIREELKDIRYYCSRKDIFEKATFVVGKNAILEKIAKYNEAICNAPPRLYDIYVSLYLQNNTQESLSERLGYTFEYISKLNTKLVKFFQKNLKNEEDEK